LDAIEEGGYSELQRSLSGGYLYVSMGGDLKFIEGIVLAEDVAAAVEAGLLDPANAKAGPTTGSAGGAADKAKPDLSAALIEDIRAMHAAAVQGAMLEKPELVLDLLAFAFAPDSGRIASIFDIQRRETGIAPTTETGFAPDPRLIHEADMPFDVDLVAAFAEFRKQGKKHRSTVLTHALARSLVYGCTGTGKRAAIFDQIETEAGASFRKVWTPTAENFFSRVNAAYLDNLLADLTGCDRNGSGFKAFASQKKKEKAAGLERLFSDAEYQKAWHIDAEKKARIDAWVPEGF